MSFPKTLPKARSRARAALLLTLAAVLAGCAAMAPSTPEEAVRERAQARWRALLAGKPEQAYQFLSPASRAVMSFERYRASLGGMAAWKSAEVFKVVCAQADRCTASIKVTYEPALRRNTLGTIETSVEEIWLLDAGQWWLPQGL